MTKTIWQCAHSRREVGLMLAFVLSAIRIVHGQTSPTSGPTTEPSQTVIEVVRPIAAKMPAIAGEEAEEEILVGEEVEKAFMWMPAVEQKKWERSALEVVRVTTSEHRLNAGQTASIAVFTFDDATVATDFVNTRSKAMAAVAGLMKAGGELKAVSAQEREMRTVTPQDTIKIIEVKGTYSADGKPFELTKLYVAEGKRVTELTLQNLTLTMKEWAELAQEASEAVKVIPIPARVEVIDSPVIAAIRPHLADLPQVSNGDWKTRLNREIDFRFPKEDLALATLQKSFRSAERFISRGTRSPAEIIDVTVYTFDDPAAAAMYPAWRGRHDVQKRAAFEPTQPASTREIKIEGIENAATCVISTLNVKRLPQMNRSIWLLAVASRERVLECSLTNMSYDEEELLPVVKKMIQSLDTLPKR